MHREGELHWQHIHMQGLWDQGDPGGPAGWHEATSTLTETKILVKFRRTSEERMGPYQDQKVLCQHSVEADTKQLFKNVTMNSSVSDTRVGPGP